MEYSRERMIRVIRKAAFSPSTDQRWLKRKDGTARMEVLERMMLPRSVSWPMRARSIGRRNTAEKDGDDLSVAVYIENLDDATRRKLVTEALHRAKGCLGCGSRVKRCQESRTRYTEDIPDIRPEVIEHTMHRD